MPPRGIEVTTLSKAAHRSLAFATGHNPSRRRSIPPARPFVKPRHQTPSPNPVRARRITGARGALFHFGYTRIQGG
jgi:hypothetical protein